MATGSRKGNAEPRVFTPPLRELTPETTLGFNAIDFAENILGITLYPWQEWLLKAGLELKENGTFRFRTLIILVARQNGKSTLGQVLALWSLYVLKVPLIIGTAQDLATAEDLWEDVADIADSNPELEPFIKAINRRNGARSLELKLGTEYKVKASTRKAARGLSSDLLLLDELREHTNWEAWGAVTKTMMARPNAQAWTLSNAGDELSVVLMSLRKKAHLALGDPDGINANDLVEVVEDRPVEETSVGIFEWSAAPGRSIWDREGWAEANPAMGYGAITEEALASAAATDPEPIFRTECLCQWILGTLEGPFPDGSWERCADLTGQIADDSELSYAVDVSVDRSTAWVAVCGSQVSGRPQVEIATGRPGGGWLEWVPQWFEQIADPADPVRVVVNARMGPVAALVEPLRLVDGVEVVEWAGPDVPMGCGLMYDHVVSVLEDKPPYPPLAHRGQEALNLAAATAAQRVSGDGWYWDRRNSAQDASPLMAATGALWDHLRIREEAPTPSIYASGPLALI